MFLGKRSLIETGSPRVPGKAETKSFEVIEDEEMDEGKSLVSIGSKARKRVKR